MADALKNAATNAGNTIQDGVNFASDKIQEATSGASKEANKNVAKDSNASIGTRASAGVDALKDASDEHGHKASATLNKESAKH